MGTTTTQTTSPGQISQLWAELDKLNRDIRSFGQANRESPDIYSGADRLPTVTGLTLTKSPGTLKTTWDAVLLRDLKHYEIQISQAADFSAALTFTTTLLSFDHPILSGDSLTELFARVRAVSIKGGTGPYSQSKLSAPGLLPTEGIIEDATSKVSNADKAAAFSLTTSYQSVLTLSVTKEEDDSDLLLQFVFVLLNNSPTVHNALFQYKILRDSTVVRIVDSPGVDVLLNAILINHYGTDLETGVAAGTYTYDLQVKQSDSGADIDPEISDVVILVEEVKK